MNINTKFATLVFALMVAFLPFAGTPVQAQSTGLQYQLLEKIPGTDNLGSDLPGYVSAIYKISLVVVTLSAVLMLSIGGFMYLTSAGNVASISTAKGIITDSLIGLIIALSAWLILYIINPDLVKISLGNLPPAQTTTAPPATAPGSIGTLPSGSDSELAEEILNTGNIGLNSTGSCSSPSGQVTPQKNIADIAHGKQAAKCSANCQTKGSSGCVDNGTNLSNKMLAAILAVGKTMSFTITSVAGGPHAGDSKHYSGSAIDIVPVNQALLDAFVKAGAFPPNGNAASMCEKDGKNVGCSGAGANHIHLIFPN